MDWKADVKALVGDVPGYIKSKFSSGDDQKLYADILTSLAGGGIAITGDVMLLVETGLQGASGEPMDDRTLLVSYISCVFCASLKSEKDRTIKIID